MRNLAKKIDGIESLTSGILTVIPTKALQYAFGDLKSADINTLFVANDDESFIANSLVIKASGTAWYNRLRVEACRYDIRKAEVSRVWTNYGAGHALHTAPDWVIGIVREHTPFGQFIDGHRPDRA